MAILGKRGGWLIGSLIAAAVLMSSDAHAQRPFLSLPPGEPSRSQPGALPTVSTELPVLAEFPLPPESGPVPYSAAPSSSPESVKLGEVAGKKVTAGWDNGFFISSEDKDFVLRITGQIQADYRFFPIENDTQDFDNFFLRRARFGLEATMFKYYEFRFLPDFGMGKAVVQDAYMNIHYWDAFQLETGKFKQPFSYEQLIQDRFVPTIERSLIDQLVPARDIGLMLHGENLFSGQLDWAVSVSNGEINGDSDLNEQKDIVARVAYRPFAAVAEPGSVLHGLQVGYSVTTGLEAEPLNPLTLRMPSTVRWLTFNPNVRSSGLRNRYSPELAYFFRTLGFAWQYYNEHEQLSPSLPLVALREDVSIEGFYFLATWLITGEERTTYSAPVVPLRSFDPYHPISCPGAWELVVRTSRLRFDQGIFTPGPGQLATPVGNSHGATELTTGFNWYLNPYVRVQFNWEHSWFDDPVQFSSGATGLHREANALMTRFQIIF
jgi:phosphate-selective porin OprO/OprP